MIKARGYIVYMQTNGVNRFDSFSVLAEDYEDAVRQGTIETMKRGGTIISVKESIPDPYSIKREKKWSMTLDPILEKGKYRINYGSYTLEQLQEELLDLKVALYCREKERDNFEVERWEQKRYFELFQDVLYIIEHLEKDIQKVENEISKII